MSGPGAIKTLGSVVELNSLLKSRACSYSAQQFLPILFGVFAGTIFGMVKLETDPGPYLKLTFNGFCNSRQRKEMDAIAQL